jgi:hypothetical protein
MKEEQSSTYRRLRLIYIGSIAVSTLLFIAVFLMNEGRQPIESILLERYAILITLIGIPLALKLFHNKTKVLNTSEIVDYLRKYYKQYVLRLIILELIFLFNLISLHRTGEKNFIFMIIITIFALVLCAPQKANLEEESEK